MMNNRLLLPLVFIFLPFIYLASVYGGLPDEIPIHFDWRGNADGWGPKYILWFLPTIGIPLILLVNAAIISNFGKTEPADKQRNIGLITLVFTSLLLCYIIYGAGTGNYDGLGGLSILFGLLFGALGNYLPVLKPNAFVGIRVPPTLKSAVKWTKTHRFAGPLFLVGGVLLVLNGLFVRGGAITVVMLITVGGISLIPVVYAYRLPDDEEGDLV
jgi:uncharacterized membrane protein